MTRTSVRRLPIVIALVVVGVLAFALGNATPDPAPAVPAPDDAAAAPPAGTRSSAWYCPGAPASVPLETQTVTIANINDVATDVVVTSYPDDLSASVSQTVPVAASTITTLPRASLGPAGPVTVVAMSSSISVDAGTEGDSQLAFGPCASTAATEWQFAAGTTVRGVQQWLILFNPFGTDAKVDISLRTDERLDQPEALQSLDVPRRSRVLVPIHDHAVRRPRVAVGVQATVGQVVAEQSMMFAPESGFSGLTRSLGALEPSTSWTFAEGAAIPFSRTMIAIVNPDVVDAVVDVRVSAAEIPLTVTIPSDGVVWVQVGGCADPPEPECIPMTTEANYWVSVESGATPVVAEQLVWFNGTVRGSGAATVIGTSEPAREIIVPRVGVRDGRAASLAFVNADANPVTADIAVVADGLIARPEAFQGVEIPPGLSLFDLAAPVVPTDAALYVTTSGPVVVSRSLYTAGDLSRSNPVVVR